MTSARLYGHLWSRLRLDVFDIQLMRFCGGEFLDHACHRARLDLEFCRERICAGGLTAFSEFRKCFSGNPE